MLEIIGLSTKQAKKFLQKKGMALRILGENAVGTCDFRQDRVNVEVKQDKIITVLGIG